ncbi:MAG: hypothetical protein AB8H86_29060 [Polyangiales bacterium]
MKSRQAKRIRAMRERMEKVAGGRVAEAGKRIQIIDKQKSALEDEMLELQAQTQAAPQASGEQLFIAASTLEKARQRVRELSAKRDDAAVHLLSVESELHDARRATEMADRLCSKLRAADDARREKLDRELSDDAGARISAQSKRGDTE